MISTEKFAISETMIIFDNAANVKRKTTPLLIRWRIHVPLLSQCIAPVRLNNNLG